jgi:hypothetical protein
MTTRCFTDSKRAGRAGPAYSRYLRPARRVETRYPSKASSLKATSRHDTNCSSLKGLLK